MIDFTTTDHCKLRAHCHACRNDAAWRAVMAQSFIMPDECPRVTGLGDWVAKVLKMPIVAGAVKVLAGVDTRKPCGGCRRRQEWLNKKVPIAFGK
jgi:hypothetical protein